MSKQPVAAVAAGAARHYIAGIASNSRQGLMARILLLYSSVYGQSQRICERLATHLAAHGHQTTVAPLTDTTLALEEAELIVIGASIRQGKHNPAVMDFVRRHLALLQSRPNAFFSVNLMARKPTRSTPASNPYLQRFVASSPWKPALLGVFAGELDYHRYGPLDRRMMRLVMWINKGPTDPDTHVEFTDWSAVQRYADDLHRLTETVPA